MDIYLIDISQEEEEEEEDLSWICSALSHICRAP